MMVLFWSMTEQSKKYTYTYTETYHRKQNWLEITTVLELEESLELRRGRNVMTL